MKSQIGLSLQLFSFLCMTCLHSIRSRIQLIPFPPPRCSCPLRFGYMSVVSPARCWLFLLCIVEISHLVLLSCPAAHSDAVCISSLSGHWTLTGTGNRIKAWLPLPMRLFFRGLFDIGFCWADVWLWPLQWEEPASLVFTLIYFCVTKYLCLHVCACLLCCF